MPESVEISERMRSEWNQRAREDANFYVAFGRRGQEDEEFFATAEEVVRGLEWELRRFPGRANQRAWRALEIGCGPGRIMKPMSRNFGEIHGVDVSDEMVERARRNLESVPHAHAHATPGSDLAGFADNSFDLVYSYAVFQHIPSRDVVMQYLREARRVMKPGALLRCQINGLDKSAKVSDTVNNTWSGVRIGACEVREYAIANDMQLLALEGARTQYMWTTMRKRSPGWRERSVASASRIRRITNAHSAEPVVPLKGRFASFTIWMEGLPPDCDLIDLLVLIDGVPGTPCYIGPPETDGLQQVNVMLPRLERTGLLPLTLAWRGSLFCEPAWLRVTPTGPLVPHILSVTDGINMLSGTTITSGSVKVTLEESEHPDEFSADIAGRTISGFDIFCADPLPPRYEINFQVPPDLSPGQHTLFMRLRKRLLQSVTLEITAKDDL